ncbi:MAG: PHP domain-containing protein [Candidatus Aenigmarchaeota archaeon]|nr:PHP domain-containing protein [Candidatus Aenigmarchaeota archaeon]
MKKWERFEGFLTRGDWHVHTNYVEGENSVLEMCEQAEKNGLQLIAFTEHVRKELDYDFNTLVRDIEGARKKFPKLKILTGCEAKILVGGGIDVSDDVLELCDIVIASFHGFYHGKEEHVQALEKTLKNPEVDIWGHPATMFRNCELERKEMEDIIKLCMKNSVLIEKNLRPKYEPPPGFLELVEKTGAKTVISSDAHSVWELRKII